MVNIYDDGLVAMTSKISGIDEKSAAKAIQFVLWDLSDRVRLLSYELDNPTAAKELDYLANIMKKHARFTGKMYEEVTVTERDYKKEYEEYHAKPEQKQRRAERNAARLKAIEAGRVKRGDNKEVDHINAPRTGSLENVPTRVVSKTENRKRQPKRK